MDDLTDAEFELLGEALRSLRRELEATVDAAAVAAAPVDLAQPIGRLSRIDAIQQQSMVQAGRRAAQRRLQQVEAALRRHQAGDYGSCLGCGAAVDSRRLQAKPEATLCLACQTKGESRRR